MSQHFILSTRINHLSCLRVPLNLYRCAIIRKLQILSIKKVSLTLLAALICINALAFLLRPIGHPDFFWHLKTGQWISEHRSLPSQDPFSYTTPVLSDSRERFILTSYWMGQVIYYQTYQWGGMKAIILLRALVAGAIIIVTLRLCRCSSEGRAALSLLFVLVLLKLFPLERPQSFSFLAFALLLHLLQRLRAHAAERTHGPAPVFISAALACLMLAWANSHGGFILGQLTIALVVAVECAKHLHPGLRPLNRPALTRLTISLAPGFLASFVNPNTYHAAIELFRIPMMFANLDYSSTTRVFALSQDYTFILYWSVLLLTAVGILLTLRETDITELLLLAGLGYMSFTQMRYIPFFMIAAMPVAGRVLQGEGVRRMLKIGVCVLALGAGVLSGWHERYAVLAPAPQEWVNRSFLPVRSVEFLATADLKGNMYNNNAWGGYLLWTLYPRYKVFSDTRSLDPGVMTQAYLIDSGYAGDLAGRPYWKTIFDVYGVRFVITPFIQFGGNLIPLVGALLDDPAWTPVFLYENSVIFVQNTTDNKQIIETYGQKKEDFALRLIKTCDEMIRSTPANAFPAIAKGDLFLRSGQINEALLSYQSALRVSPLNPVAHARIKQIEQMRNNRTNSTGTR